MSRYPDSRGYPRDRSPPRYDRRSSSGFGSSYHPSHPDSAPLNSRDTPRGAGSASLSGLPSAPRGQGPANRGAHLRDTWRADYDRDRDRDRNREYDRRDDRRDSRRDDRREDRDDRRRPSPPRRRSPLRDGREAREYLRDVDISRARRTSRDGPLSGGSTYPDTLLGGPQSYRGTGVRDGRDWDARGRGRPPPHDGRTRREPYRQRSPSREPIRRDRHAARDDRDIDRRTRDERRPDRRGDGRRGHDSYFGSASSRAMDSATIDTRHHSTTALPPASSERSTYGEDPFSRRPSLSAASLTSRDARRDPERTDHGGREEAARDRHPHQTSLPSSTFGPIPSKPPQYPASGHNVWKNPALTKPAQQPRSKPAAPHLAIPAAPVTASAAAAAPASAPASMPDVHAARPAQPVPSGLTAAPPTGPKASRVTSVLPGERHTQPARHGTTEPGHSAPSSSLSSPSVGPSAPMADTAEFRAPPLPMHSPHVPNKPRGAPVASQGGAQPSVSLSQPFRRLPPSPIAVSASQNPRPPGPRNTSALSVSPTIVPAPIPTGPRADRNRPSNFGSPWPAGGSVPKSNQWVRPGVQVPSRQTVVPSKREHSGDDNEQQPLGSARKAAKLEKGQFPPVDWRRGHGAPSLDPAPPEQSRLGIGEELAAPESVAPFHARPRSDVSMRDASPVHRPPTASHGGQEASKTTDNDEDVDVNEREFATKRALNKKQQQELRAKLMDLSAQELRATTPLRDMMLLANVTKDHLVAQLVDAAETDRRPSSSMSWTGTALAGNGFTNAPFSTSNRSTPNMSTTEDLAVDDSAEDTNRRLRGNPSETSLTADEPRGYGRASPPLPRLVQSASDGDFDIAMDVARNGASSASSTAELEPAAEGPLALDACRDTRGPYSLERAPMGSDAEDIDFHRLISDFMRSERHGDTTHGEGHQQILLRFKDAYKIWRRRSQPLDETRAHEDGPRLPTLGTVSSITNRASAPVVGPEQAGGRRSHTGRFSTALEYQKVLQDSIETARAERSKKDMAALIENVQRSTLIPTQRTVHEIRQQCLMGSGGAQMPGQGMLVYHYEPLENDFSAFEHETLLARYAAHPKQWGKLADLVSQAAGTQRTYKDCINHYYATKWTNNYKGKGRKRAAIKKGRAGAARGKILANPFLLGEMPMNERGRPRRAAAPTFGAEVNELEGMDLPERDAANAPPEKGKRGKGQKDKGSTRRKNQPVPAGPSPLKSDRRPQGPRLEEVGARSLPEDASPTTALPGLLVEEPRLPSLDEAGPHVALGADRSKPPSGARQAFSSYWSVQEQNDFRRNVAHFGTDFVAISNHMGTKTPIMVKNQYQRLLEGGSAPELVQRANEADTRKERGEDLGPPPTPSPGVKRRYDAAHVPGPRTLAPTPEAADTKHPPSLPAKPSPPRPGLTSARFASIAQVPPHPTPSSGGMPVVPEVAGLLGTAQPPPLAKMRPSQLPPQAQSQQPFLQQPPGHSHHPPSYLQSGFAPNEFATREVRPPPGATLPLQTHSALQQMHAQVAAPQPAREAFFQPYPEQASQMKPDSRRVSQELVPARPYRSSPLAAGQASSQARPVPLSMAGSPTSGSVSSQHNLAAQPALETEVPSQAPFTTLQHIRTRPTVVTPPLMVEKRPRLMAQAQPMQSSTPVLPPVGAPSLPPPVSKPSEPRRSNVLSLLNATEPEEPRRRKQAEPPPPSQSSTPHPPLPSAPPPLAQSVPARREVFNVPMAPTPYSRPTDTPPPPPSQSVVAPRRQVVDLTREQPSGARFAVDSWAVPPSLHSTPAPSALQVSSPRHALAQPPPDTRMHGNHRAMLAQHNAPQHNPSPPPHATYAAEAHLHSRTPSLSHQGPQVHHGFSMPPIGHAQQPAGTAPVLQPNPYAQLDPTVNSQTTNVGSMRPGSHFHAGQLPPPRDMGSRANAPQAHLANPAYSSLATNEPSHANHRRGPSDAIEMLPSLARAHETLRQFHEQPLQERASLPPLPDFHPALQSRHPPAQQPPLERTFLGARSMTPLARPEHPQQHLPPPPPFPQRFPPTALGDTVPHPSHPHRLRDSLTAVPPPLGDAPHHDARDYHLGGRDDYLARERDVRMREDLARRERDGRLIGIGLPPPPPSSSHAAVPLAHMAPMPAPLPPSTTGPTGPGSGPGSGARGLWRDGGSSGGAEH